MLVEVIWTEQNPNHVKYIYYSFEWRCDVALQISFRRR